MGRHIHVRNVTCLPRKNVTGQWPNHAMKKIISKILKISFSDRFGSVKRLNIVHRRNC